MLELIEGLINPEKYDQTSIPWLFVLPEGFSGKPYATLASKVLASGALPLGLLRSSGGGGLPTVVTCCPNETYELRPDDAVSYFVCVLSVF